MNPSELKVITTLKEDAFGKIELRELNGERVICRDYSDTGLFSGLLAGYLARREAKVLKALDEVADHRLPRLIHFGDKVCIRSYIEGVPLKEGAVSNPEFYANAREVLDKMHAAGVVHNDLEKPENWLVISDEVAGIIDFQLAYHSKKRGKIYRWSVGEDIRHLVKQKNRYSKENMSEEELQILNNRSGFGLFWSRRVKPVYNFVTRKILNYSDREHSKYSR
jgi:RIO-like serine/threonine protein kinase